MSQTESVSNDSVSSTTGSWVGESEGDDSTKGEDIMKIEETPSFTEEMSDIVEETIPEPPILKREETKMIIDKKKEDEVQCTRCWKFFNSKRKHCPECRQYNIKPGETIDLSEKNFTFPFQTDLTPPVYFPKGSELTDPRFAKPFPPVSGDVADERELQERVFNALPLTDEQLKQLKKDLILDYMKERREKIKRAKIEEKERPHHADWLRKNNYRKPVKHRG